MYHSLLCRKTKAFTLIELAIVIAIISILTATVVIFLGSARLKAGATRGLVDIRQIQVYIETYEQNYGSYPVSCSGGGGWAARNPHRFGCNLGICWIPELAADGCPLPYNQNAAPPTATQASDSQYLYWSNGVDYKLIYHVPVSMSVPGEFIDPRRPTWAFGVWTPGARNW